VCAYTHVKNTFTMQSDNILLI